MDALCMSEVEDKEVQSLIPLLRGIKRSLSFYRVGDFRFQCCCWRSWVLCEHTSTWFTAHFFFISNSPVPYTLSPSSVTSGLSNPPWPSNLSSIHSVMVGIPLSTMHSVIVGMFIHSGFHISDLLFLNVSYKVTFPSIFHFGWLWTPISFPPFVL